MAFLTRKHFQRKALMFMSAMQHIVLIKFPQALTEADTRWIDAHLSLWLERIGGIARIHWGEDVSGRSRGYQWGLTIEFTSPEAESQYHPHPVHQEFAQWVAAAGGEVLAFDFPFDRPPTS